MGTVRYTVFDGEITSEYRNGVLHDYLVDPLGSTVALVDNTQTITDTFSYSAFGEVVNHVGGTPTPFQYVGSKGYYRDSNTRTHVRARNFYVNLGKWSTQDPIWFDGGDWNLYRYCENNPIILMDASGLECTELSYELPPSGYFDCSAHPSDDPKPRRNICPRDNDEKKYIRQLCKFDRVRYDVGQDTLSGDVPGGTAAEATCCNDRKHPDASQCAPVIGQTQWYPNLWKTTPGVYQKPLIDHERRRRQCCKDTCGWGLNPKNDAAQFLRGVWDSLLKCYKGNERQLKKDFPECYPPPSIGGVCLAPKASKRRRSF